MLGLLIIFWVMLVAWLILTAKTKLERLYIFESVTATYIFIAAFAVFLSFMTIKTVNIKKPSPQTRTLNADAEVAKVATAVESLKKDIGRFPAIKEGLAVLINGRGITGWHGPYLKSPLLLTDPWGNFYNYGVIQTREGTVFFVGSRGPNQEWDTPQEILEKQQASGDDVLKWSK